MTTSAKKICIGEYEYKGCRISQIYTWEDKPSHWNIYLADEPLLAVDSADTLRECKAIIDKYPE